jgi:hypothetical protein
MKFDANSTKEIFMRYSMKSKTYINHISSSHIVVESVHIKSNECTNKETEKYIKIIGI